MCTALSEGAKTIRCACCIAQ
ncbi:MAG: hypothetical protein CVU34_11270 [Betaproteobacteria bacterium HGW-Betaproteobacteria-7]|nr:MAG: hypothetical protein CVU34_11270 [Betaproteobacteria bacterium HGW-Betaproteobacteria-7]